MDTTRKGFIGSLFGLASIPVVGMPKSEFQDLDDDKDYILGNGKGPCFIRNGAVLKEALSCVMHNRNQNNMLGQTIKRMSKEEWFFLDIRYDEFGNFHKSKIVITEDWLWEFWNRNKEN